MEGVEQKSWGFEISPVPRPQNRNPASTVDLERIQYALDHVRAHPNNKVLLRHGEYDLGTGTLQLNRAVQLVGEKPVRRRTGGFGAERGVTVVGGGAPPSDHFAIVWGAANRVSATIQDIRFQGFIGDAIRIYRTEGSNAIRGCSFVSYEPIDRAPLAATGGRILLACPIVLEPTARDPDDLQGTLRIEHCFIGGPITDVQVQVDANSTRDYDPAIDAINNILHLGNSNLDLHVVHNELVDMYWVPIMVWGNKGETTITDNVIVKNNSYWRDGAAISFGMTNAAYYNAAAWDGRATIARNDIRVASPTSYGIMVTMYSGKLSQAPPLNAPHVTVEHNTISMEGKNERAALACLGGCDDTLWTGNKVNGSAAYGILISRSVPEGGLAETQAGPTSNRFVGNDLSGLFASYAQAFITAEAELSDLDRNTFGSLWAPPVPAFALKKERAGIFCNGTSGGLFLNRFVSMWAGAPYAIHLGKASSKNLVRWTPGNFPPATVGLPDAQILDEGKLNDVARLHPVVKKPPKPKVAKKIAKPSPPVRPRQPRMTRQP
ncbi:MAG TPA: hypothetical protein VFZ69_13900 [Longimicrobiales bacterium]